MKKIKRNTVKTLVKIMISYERIIMIASRYNGHIFLKSCEIFTYACNRKKRLYDWSNCIRLNVIQDRRYLTLSEARNKKLSLDWTTFKPGKVKCKFRSTKATKIRLIHFMIKTV